MIRTHKPFAGLMIGLLLSAALPSLALAQSARLEGYLLDVDGRAAGGFRVHLIDDRGADVAQSSASAQGVYSFRELAAGSYSLGIEDTAGRMAPVAAPPVALAKGGLVRRDIKLIASEDPRQAQVGQQNESLGLFWAGLSPAVKASSVVGVVIVLGLVISSIDDESSSSQSIPD
jgi:hypothetical protein